MAPPGAGKTTRVPLALLGQITGKIVMLEPRRLAARAAAPRTLARAVPALRASVAAPACRAFSVSARRLGEGACEYLGTF